MKTNLAAVITLFLAITACGESRSVQCDKIGGILNSTATQLMTASGTAEGFSQGAVLEDQAAADLEVLELGDKKLSNMRSHLAAAYRSNAVASREMDAIAGADGTVISNTGNNDVVARFEQANQEFSSIFTATQTYCNGGDVPTEYTEQPAP